MLNRNFLFSILVFLFGVNFLPGLFAQVHHENQSLPCVNKNYNLLVHVAVDSTDRAPLITETDLDKILITLNKVFDPICVSFSGCEYKVMENDYSLGRVVDKPLTTQQQLEELKTRFSLRRRINVFILDYIRTEHCGSSTFNGILTYDDANIFVERACLDSYAMQIAHHLGHTFGLSNTYDSGSIELVDGSNCETAGDRLCDTPADPFGQTFASPEDQILINGMEINTDFTRGCEFVYEVKDPNGDYYTPDVGNIMSYYPCKCGFSQDQFRLMVETILKSDIEHF